MRGKLRERKGRAGKSSLYIVYYPPVFNPTKNVYTRTEFLKLYVIDKPKNDFEKSQNKLNREIAEKILLKRLKGLMLEGQNLFNEDILQTSFYDFAKQFILSKERQGKDVTHYTTLVKYLKRYHGDQLKFSTISERFISEFKEFLLSTTRLSSNRLKLQTNSASSYFDKFLTLIETAVQKRYLQHNPVPAGSRIKPLKPVGYFIKCFWTQKVERGNPASAKKGIN